jgi:hypothetical protein
MPGGTVYCLRFGAPTSAVYKIGHASDVMRRIAHLRTGTPIPLTLLYTVTPHVASASAVETEIHMALGEYRIQPPRNVVVGVLHASAGREFFGLTGWDVSGICELMTRICAECDTDARDEALCETLARTPTIDTTTMVEVSDVADSATITEQLRRRAVLCRRQAEATREIARIDMALKHRIGTTGGLRLSDGSLAATWLPYVRRHLNRARLRRENPALHQQLEQYTDETCYRRFAPIGSCGIVAV